MPVLRWSPTKWRKAEADIKADLETLQGCRADGERCSSPAGRRFRLHRRLTW